MQKNCHCYINLIFNILFRIYREEENQQCLLSLTHTKLFQFHFMPKTEMTRIKTDQISNDSLTVLNLAFKQQNVNKN